MSAPDVSLVFYRDGPGCIERVTVVDGQSHVKQLTLGEALNTMADLAVITARLQHRINEKGQL